MREGRIEGATVNAGLAARYDPSQQCYASVSTG